MQKRCGCCTRRVCACLLLAFGILQALVSVAMFAGMPAFVKFMVIQKSAMSKTSDEAQEWKEAVGEGIVRVYLFHVLNALEVEDDPTIRPQLEQRGPFAYRMTNKKEGVTWSDDDELVSYRRFSSLVFLPDLSNGTEQDEVTVVSMPYVASTHMLRDANWFVRFGANSLLKGIFTKRTVRELMFGYESGLEKLTDPNDMKRFLGLKDDESTNNGVLTTLNGSSDGLFTVYTGVGDIERRGRIHSWNHQTSVNYWSSPEANLINGTDGGMWSTYLDDVEQLQFFVPQMCRTLTLTRTADVTVSGSIDGVRYSQLYEMYNYSTNHEFCPEGVCPLAGLLNVSACRLDMPVLISYPHFAGGDPALRERFEGLDENPQYISYMDIHPTLGFTMGVSQKIQLNMHIMPSEHYLTDWPETVFPFVWLEQSVTLTEEQVGKFKFFGTMMKLNGVMPYVVVCVAVILLVAGITLLVLYQRDNQQDTDDVEKKPLEELSKRNSYITADEPSTPDRAEMAGLLPGKESDV